jgi:hypothetical protein
MGLYKVVWEFNENTGATFSEVYYISSNSAADACAVAGPGAAQGSNFQKLRDARLALLDTLNNLARVRASNVQALRDTAVNVINLPGTSASGGGPAPAGEAVVLQLTGVPSGQRHLWMRGCPQSFIARDPVSGRDKPPQGLLTGLQNWQPLLNANTYGILKHPATSKYPIISVYQGLDATTAVIVCVQGSQPNPPPWIGMAAPFRVRVSAANIKLVPGINGSFNVLASGSQVVGGGTQYLTTVRLSGISATPVAPGGFIAFIGTPTVNIFTSNPKPFAYFGTHATKVPLFHSRGARRARLGRRSQ